MLFLEHEGLDKCVTGEEVVWLRQLKAEILGHALKSPTIILCDKHGHNQTKKTHYDHINKEA